MVDLDLSYTPATELARLIRAGELSSVEAVRNSLERIEQVNPTLNCFCFVYPDEALEQAGEADRAAAAGGELGPLHGVPIAIKDLTPTAGKTTTMGSYAFEHFVPDRTRSSSTSCSGPGRSWSARRPRRSSRTRASRRARCGGSRGTRGTGENARRLVRRLRRGGGVRLRAARRGNRHGRIDPHPGGVVGHRRAEAELRPHPLDFLPTQFDTIQHVGPLARTVADAGSSSRSPRGPDERDIMSLAPALDLSEAARRLGRGPSPCARRRSRALRRRLPRSRRRHANAAAALAEAGAEVEEVDLGWTREVADAWVDHWGVYLAAIFGTAAGVPRRMDPRVVKLMDAGLAMSAVDFKRLEFVRTRAWQELAPILERHDAFLCPTMSVPAPPVDKDDFEFYRDQGDGLYHALDMTSQFNYVSQCPVLSRPVGLERRRPADRAPDRRPPLPGRPGAAHRGRPGTGSSLGAPPPARLTRAAPVGDRLSGPFRTP